MHLNKPKCVVLYHKYFVAENCGAETAASKNNLKNNLLELESVIACLHVF